MILTETQAATNRRRGANNETNTRLTGRWLMLARAAWLILVAFAFVLLVASLPHFPTFFALLQTPCTGKACSNTTYQLSLTSMQTLAKFGISPLAIAIFFAATFSLIPAFVWILVGVILVWHRSDDWMALLVSLLLILWGFNFATVFGAVVPPVPAWHLTYLLLGTFSQALIFLLFFLFPNGRFVPRWTLWLAIAGVLDAAFSVFPGLLPSINWLFAGPVFIFLLACMLVAQIYRYVRVSTPLQRQQTKWLLYGISIVFLVSDLGFAVLSSIFPSLAVPGSLGNAFLGGVLWAILLLCIPISIGIAMLRYRLWDIDIIINRTLVYGSLTVLLAALYVGLVIGLESLVGLITERGSQQPVALVISTLAIAALFQPLRKRIQAVIDRRFYRRKYDAQKTLAAFSATLRNEVDLATLSEQLVAVVEETMQPAHVSLWLRQPERRKERQNTEEGGAR